MGIPLFSSTCKSTPSPTAAAAAPNPRNFIFIRVMQVGRAVVAKVFYPQCTNYEGNKILVFDNTTVDRIISRGSMDPHFREKKGGPVARVEPTARGWDLAVKIADMLDSGAVG